MHAVFPRSRPGRQIAAVLAAAALAAGTVLTVTGPGSAPVIGNRLLAAADTVPAPGLCTGTVLARFPAVAGVTDTAGAQGGYLWWRAQAAGVCVGTVVVDIRYAGVHAQPWQVTVYDDRDPGGQAIARVSLPAPEPGTYQFMFSVHRMFPGLSAVCVGAVSCVTFGAPY